MQPKLIFLFLYTMKTTRRFYGFLLFALLCSSAVVAAPPGGGPPPPAGLPPPPPGLPFQLNTQALFCIFVLGYSFYLIFKYNKRSLNRT
ncbi:hypothetical protein CHX27_01840 [Flavobacterium aurantiibacter]|uniref:Signal peptidase n=1 Tax=Flavobacterium aurantiibacter TaxID=2023067 RepID=A0A256A759_9FLAO|nr:hypothetical protein CHX27_01840 [Flavobacterium aurantiibacter]